MAFTGSDGYNPRPTPSAYDPAYFKAEFPAIRRQFGRLPDLANGRNGVFNVLDFGGMQSNGDITSALRRAQEQANLAGGGVVLLPPMRAFIGDFTILYSHIVIRGCGTATQLKKLPLATYGISVNPGAAGSPDPATNLTGIGIDNLVMIGNSVSGAFSEHKHLLNLNALSDFWLSRLTLSEFEGDGIFLGSSNTAATERHNERGVLWRIALDGVNQQNRNGLSVIDATDLWCETMTFANCTAPTMPGAIDLESDPTSPFARLRNLNFRDIGMRNIGGNVGAFSLVVPLAQSALTTPVSVISIDTLAIDGCVSAFCGLQEADATATSTPIGVRLRNITARNGTGRPFVVNGLVDVDLDETTWTDFAGSASTGESYRCRDITRRRTTFERCGTTAGTGEVVANVDGLRRVKDIYADCGLSTGGGTGITYATGMSSGVTQEGLTFRAPLGRMSTSVTNSGHTFAPDTNLADAATVYLDGVASAAGQFFPYPPGAVSADRGDANVTLIAGMDAPVQRFGTNLTAARTVTLPAAMANADDRGRYRIALVQPSPGAFSFTVQTSGAVALAVVPSGHNGTIDVGWDGAAFHLIGLAIT